MASRPVLPMLGPASPTPPSMNSTQRLPVAKLYRSPVVQPTKWCSRGLNCPPENTSFSHSQLPRHHLSSATTSVNTQPKLPEASARSCATVPPNARTPKPAPSANPASNVSSRKPLPTPSFQMPRRVEGVDSASDSVGDGTP